MAIPSLRKVLPFPATTDYTFEFDVSGVSDQIIYNTLEVKLSSDTSTVLYSQQIQEFRYEHTLPADTLTNGEQYVATIKIYDVSNVLMGESSPIFFYCFSEPILSIPTITDGEVGNQTVVFQGTYAQAENELLQSYQFVLYNDNQFELSRSSEIFDTTIEYEFSELTNRQKYYIELRVWTVNEMTATTGLIEFTPRYIAPRFNSALDLENLPNEASISVNCNIIRIVGIPDIEPVNFINDDYADMTDNGIWFDEGFKVRGNWTLQMWLKDIVIDSIFFKLIALDGSNVELEYKDGVINLYKKLDDDYILQKLIGESVIDTTDQMIFICIKQIDGLYDISYEMVVS